MRGNRLSDLDTNLETVLGCLVNAHGKRRWETDDASGKKTGKRLLNGGRARGVTDDMSLWLMPASSLAPLIASKLNILRRLLSEVQAAFAPQE